MAKNKLVGIYFEEKMLKEINDFAKLEGIDRTAFIKRAIQDSLDDLALQRNDLDIEDYVNLRISEEELKKSLGWKQVPKDLQEARKGKLREIKEGKGR